jgi:hypothetical protein
MSGFVAGNIPCAKGAICYCLDEFSKGRGARPRVGRLRDAVAALAPAFNGLTAVFDRYLLSHVFTNAAERAPVVAHLQQHWFDQTSPDAFFPGVPVASIYAQGVLRALDLALAGRRVVPLNAWWLLDYPEVKLLSLADVDQAGVTIGGRVTLLILTPRPQDSGRPTRPILGETAQALVTEYRDNSVITIDVRRETPQT